MNLPEILSAAVGLAVGVVSTLVVMRKSVLPLLASLAEQTKTPKDDEIIKIVDGAFAVAVSALEDFLGELNPSEEDEETEAEDLDALNALREAREVAIADALGEFDE